MAFYILILKKSDDADTMTYRFGKSETEMGRLRINRLNGDIEKLESPPGHATAADALYQRAVWRLHKHLASNEFPDRTVWAS